MKLVKKVKSSLLTYLFKDWVKAETDIDCLIVAKEFIDKRKNELVGHTTVIGFRSNS